MVGSDGVAPPEPEGSEFTARPATNYGITPHIGSRSRSRTRSVGVKFQSVYHYTNRLYVIRVKTNDLSVFDYNLIQKTRREKQWSQNPGEGRYCGSYYKYRNKSK